MKICFLVLLPKRYSIIDQHLAWHFKNNGAGLLSLPPFLCSQIIIPFSHLMHSANQERGLWFSKCRNPYSGSILQFLFIAQLWYNCLYNFGKLLLEALLIIFQLWYLNFNAFIFGSITKRLIYIRGVTKCKILLVIEKKYRKVSETKKLRLNTF